MGPTATEVALESVVIVLDEESDTRRTSTISGTHTTTSIATPCAPQMPMPATTPPAQAQAWLQRNRSRIFSIASKLAALASLLLTALMAWPAIASSADASKATRLAEWTSLKDFLEYCETHDWGSKNCAPLRTTWLPPPPTKWALLRRVFGTPPSNATGDWQADSNTLARPTLTLPIYIRATYLTLGTVAYGTALIWALIILRRGLLRLRDRGKLKGVLPLLSGGEKIYREYLARRATSPRQSLQLRAAPVHHWRQNSRLQPRPVLVWKVREAARTGGSGDVASGIKRKLH